MFECTTFPVALAGQHKVSLHLGDVQLREFCYSQITFFERFWRLEKTSCLFSLFVSCLVQNRLAMKLKVKKICSQVPHRDALPWWSQCMVSSDATNRKTTKWDCQIGRWRFASASTNSLCYLSISFTFIYFSPWPTTGGEANNAAISCVPGDEKGSEQKLTKCWCVLMHINIQYIIENLEHPLISVEDEVSWFYVPGIFGLCEIVWRCCPWYSFIPSNSTKFTTPIAHHPRPQVALHSVQDWAIAGFTALGGGVWWGDLKIYVTPNFSVDGSKIYHATSAKKSRIGSINACFPF